MSASFDKLRMLTFPGQYSVCFLGVSYKLSDQIADLSG